jgi:hypothetical protein
VDLNPVYPKDRKMVGAKYMHNTGLNLMGNGTHASNAKDIVRDDGEQNPICAHR